VDVDTVSGEVDEGGSGVEFVGCGSVGVG